LGSKSKNEFFTGSDDSFLYSTIPLLFSHEIDLVEQSDTLLLFRSCYHYSLLSPMWQSWISSV